MSRDVIWRHRRGRSSGRSKTNPMIQCNSWMKAPMQEAKQGAGDLTPFTYDVDHTRLHQGGIDAAMNATGHDLVQQPVHNVLIRNELPQIKLQIVAVDLQQTVISVTNLMQAIISRIRRLGGFRRATGSNLDRSLKCYVSIAFWFRFC